MHVNRVAMFTRIGINLVLRLDVLIVMCTFQLSFALILGASRACFSPKIVFAWAYRLVFANHPLSALVAMCLFQLEFALIIMGLSFSSHLPSRWLPKHRFNLMSTIFQVTTFSEPIYALTFMSQPYLYCKDKSLSLSHF